MRFVRAEGPGAASKVLVTGGAGFIGSNLVRALLERGDDVRVLDSFSTGYRQNLDSLDVDLVEGDLRSYERVAAAVKGVEVVAAVPYALSSMASHPDVLSITSARKRFGDVAALDGATLSLREGELLALLGPNGAGKTTLIRAIAGRVALDEGEIRLFGKPIEGRRTSPGLGIVPQELAVYPLLSARENLEAFGRLQGLSRSDLAGRVKWALTVAALDDRMHEPVKQSSGGMKRRLNIACGVLHRPRVVLLDEPTVGVDPQSRERITTCWPS